MAFEQPGLETQARVTRDIFAEMQARESMEMDGGGGGGEEKAIDFLGPLMRRKSIIILFALVACGIGYLMYRKEVPTYQSGLRIMIFTQAPPTFINGETTQMTVSLPKQQALISSEYVIEGAIKNGKLGELETFKNFPRPFPVLKQSMKVVPSPNATDALDITCSGPVAEELPKILEAVVASYERFLNDDSSGSAQRSIDLVEKVQLQIGQDSEEKKKRVHELLSKLDVRADDDSSEYKNETIDLMKQLDSQKKERNLLLAKVTEKLNGLFAASRLEGDELADALKSIAIEAERYLSIDGYHTNSTSLLSDSVDRVEQIRRHQALMDQNNNSIEQLEIQKRINSRTFGENHPSSTRFQYQIEGLKSHNQGLLEEKDRLQNQIETAKGKEAANEKEAKNNGAANISQSSIRIYHVTLKREQAQHLEAIRVIDEQMATLDEKLPLIRSEMAELNMLKNELRVKELSNRGMMDKLSQITVMANNFVSTRVKVINSPQIGGVVAPILRNYLLFSALIGGLLGAGLAILIDRADLTFRNPYEIFQKMKVPVICKIPTISKLKGKNEFGCVPTLVTALDPRSSGAEAFRACRTALLFFANHSGAKIFLLSSPSAGDGKSTTVSNLAVSLAQSGKRVVILDSDMRRPRQHKYFGMAMKPGMMAVEAKTATLDEIIRPTFQANLFLVTCGGHPPNPGEFVVSEQFKDILQGLRERFDFVLIDSPPLLPVADATSISTQVDGVILVFRIRKGIVLASQKARELLDLVHARMLGIIVNGVDKNPYYNEYGGYGYPSHSGYSASRYYEKQAKEYSETADS